MKKQYNILVPGNWGLMADSNGELCWEGFRLNSLAREFNTPLYIINESRLFSSAKEFKSNVSMTFGNRGSVYYPFKCNSVPAVVNTIKRSGLSAEVMTEFELELALKSGFQPEEIIVNGPCKTEKFLVSCIQTGVKFIITDSLSELLCLKKIAAGKEVKILLRVNPGISGKGLAKESTTGSKSSWFGLDSSEVSAALDILKGNKSIKFWGVHFHIGTGIREPSAYSKTISKLYPLFRSIRCAGFNIKILDVGGGFASMTTRGLSSWELFLSQVFHSYGFKWGKNEFYDIESFLKEIKRAVSSFFVNLPEIFFEPGRCIVSPNQLLLLTIVRIKQRGRNRWLITDGGLGTVTMPSYYEYHEVFPCNRIYNSVKEKVTITGPCCFASDIVYKNKLMPRVKEGDVLALMDSGAYFVALESSFNFPKPGIVSISGDKYMLVRRRESINEMFARDSIEQNLYDGVKNEVLCC